MARNTKLNDQKKSPPASKPSEIVDFKDEDSNNKRKLQKLSPTESVTQYSLQPSPTSRSTVARTSSNFTTASVATVSTPIVNPYVARTPVGTVSRSPKASESVRSSITTSPSSMTNTQTPPTLSLSDFGLQASNSVLQSTVERFTGDTLKCCVILCEGMVKHILFRCIPREGSTNCWYEKLFSESVRNKSAWLEHLYITQTLPWWNDGVPQINGRNYPIRLFCINSMPVLFDDEKIQQIRRLGAHICEMLHALNDFKYQGIQPAADFFWLTPETAVLSDVTGKKEVLGMIKQLCGSKHDNVNFYNTHRAYLNCCFRSDQITADIGDELGYPSNLIIGQLPQVTALEEDNTSDAEWKELEQQYGKLNHGKLNH
jgi:hypothetical protein